MVKTDSTRIYIFLHYLLRALGFLIFGAMFTILLKVAEIGVKDDRYYDVIKEDEIDKDVHVSLPRPVVEEGQQQQLGRDKSIHIHTFILRLLPM